MSALHIVHYSDIVHRGQSPTFYIKSASVRDLIGGAGLNLRCVGLAPREGMGTSKVVKLCKVGYHVRLLDLHRSDPFGFSADFRADVDNTPEGW